MAECAIDGIDFKSIVRIDFDTRLPSECYIAYRDSKFTHEGYEGGDIFYRYYDMETGIKIFKLYMLWKQEQRNDDT